MNKDAAMNKYLKTKKAITRIIVVASVQLSSGKKKNDVDEYLNNECLSIMHKYGLNFMRDAWDALVHSLEKNNKLVVPRKGQPNLKVNVYWTPIDDFMKKFQ